MITIETTKALHKAHNSDAGWDIAASGKTIIPAGQSRVISTNLRMAIPEGWVGILKSRSGLSVRKRLEVGAGVIDAGYRGEIAVHIHNLGFDDVLIEEGDRIAQLLVLPVPDINWVVVDELPDSPRSGNGFGSTGA